MAFKLLAQQNTLIHLLY